MTKKPPFPLSRRPLSWRAVSLGLALTSLLGCNEILGNQPPGDGGLGGDAGESGSGGTSRSSGGARSSGGRSAAPDGGQAGAPGSGGRNESGGSGDGGVGGGTASSGGTSSGGAATTGEPCDEEDATSCRDGEPKTTLRCTEGFWEEDTPCASKESCDRRTGRCAPIVEDCLELAPEDIFCDDENNLRRCGPDRVTTTLALECPGLCDEEELACVDECAEDHGGCDELVTCSTTPEGPACGPCPSSYRSDPSGVCAPTLLDLELLTGTLESSAPTGFDYSARLGLFEDTLSFRPETTSGSTLFVDGSALTGDTFQASVPLRVSTFSLSVRAPGRPDTNYDLRVSRGEQRHYLKAPTTSDSFGYQIALSGDGSTLAVGTLDAAVHLYARSNGSFRHIETLSAPAAAANSQFGRSLALSHDGSVLVAGDAGESAGITILVGAAYVFRRVGDTFQQEARLIASDRESQDYFGRAVAISGDGNTIAIGIPGEASNATGINGNESNALALGSGAVYAFVRSGNDWLKHAFIKPHNTGQWDAFGGAVSLSFDGNLLAVGARAEDSGDPSDGADNSKSDSGAAYVFARSSGSWSQRAYLKPSAIWVDGSFGHSVSLSADGSTLAVGASGDDSAASGATYVFVRSGNTWSEQAMLKPFTETPRRPDAFGSSVALSEDGSLLIAGAPLEDSAATGIGGDRSNTSAQDSGAAYAFARSGSSWSEVAYVKASNTNPGDVFGFPVALSSDGKTIVVGASGEGSSAAGLDGNQADNSAPGSGAVYIF